MKHTLVTTIFATVHMHTIVYHAVTFIVKHLAYLIMP